MARSPVSPHTDRCGFMSIPHAWGYWVVSQMMVYYFKADAINFAVRWVRRSGLPAARHTGRSSLKTSPQSTSEAMAFEQDDRLDRLLKIRAYSSGELWRAVHEAQVPRHDTASHLQPPQTDLRRQSHGALVCLLSVQTFVQVSVQDSVIRQRSSHFKGETLPLENPQTGQQKKRWGDSWLQHFAQRTPSFSFVSLKKNSQKLWIYNWHTSF